MPGLRRRDWVGRLHQISAPILIIHGTEDPVIPYAYALALDEAFPNATLVKLEGTGHELPRAEWPKILEAIERRTAT